MNSHARLGSHATSFAFMWFVLFTASAAVILGGCSGGGGGDAPALDFTGSWSGTWTRADGGATGTVALTFGDMHMGHGMSGTCVYTNSQCVDGGNFSGMCTGLMVSGSIVGGGMRVDCKMEAQGDPPVRMHGTYEMIGAGSCAGEMGIIEFQRSALLDTLDDHVVLLRVESVGPAMTEWMATVRAEAVWGVRDERGDGRCLRENEVVLRTTGVFDSSGCAQAVFALPKSYRWSEIVLRGQGGCADARAVPPLAIVALRMYESANSP